MRMLISLIAAFSLSALGVVIIQPAAVTPGGVPGPANIHAATSNLWTTGSTMAVTMDHGSGDNRLALVCVSWYDSTTPEISGISNGSPFTQLGWSRWFTDTNQKMEIWYQKAPATGSQTTTITFNSAPAEACFSLFILTNVNQSATFGTLTTNYVDDNAISIDVASATNDCVVLYSTVSTQPVAATWTNATQRSVIDAGSATHSDSVAVGVGWATTTPAVCVWGEGNSAGGLGVVVNGF